MDLSILRRVAEEMIPFNRFLGVRVVSLETGRVELSIPWRDELTGDWTKPALHGGVISALADTAGGCAVWGAIEHPGATISTIDLRIDYLRPGRSEALFAEAVTLRVGRNVGVADVRLFHASARSEVIATARGVYAIKTPKSTLPALPQ
jgi:uncharacterized protein (TIGR00369 family)